jgi:hypothetical protein
MTGIELYSTTAASNNSASPNGWPEGMAPSAVNDAARQMMAAIRTWYEDAQWIKWGDTTVYVGATQFKISGSDVTARYTVGRRVRAVGSSTGTIYGTISASAFATDTTVTVSWDSGSLSNETLTISIGILTFSNTASPFSAPFIDSTAIIRGSADATKLLKIEVDGFTTATTRVLTPPNYDGTIATLAGSETFTNKTLTSAVVGTQAAGDNSTMAASTAYVDRATTPNGTQTNVSAPTGTTNTTGVMMGLAGAITPGTSGTVLVTICGQMGNTVSGDGCKYQIRYGTGSAPANAAALTGTAVGPQPNPIFFPTPSYTSPFSITAVITGLTPGTAYWIDLTLAAVTGGTASVANVGVSAIEVH